MEKDNFQDRSKESKIYSEVNIGDKVYVCEKFMQQYAKELEHLTLGTVTRKLTKRDHPRGIKVEIIMEGLDVKVVGRVVYVLRNGVIVRNNE